MNTKYFKSYNLTCILFYGNYLFTNHTLTHEHKYVTPNENRMHCGIVVNNKIILLPISRDCRKLILEFLLVLTQGHKFDVSSVYRNHY